MAENLETSFNFGIQDTMDMGLGNAELLSDLMSPETSSANPEDIKEIKEDVKQPTPSKETKKETHKEEEKKEDEKKSIQSFLFGDEDDTEEESDDKKSTEKKETPEDNADDKESTFSALSKDLLKLGVFSSEDGEEETPITTAEEFLERFKKEKQKGAIEVVNNFIGQFGEDYQQAFEAIYVKNITKRKGIKIDD